MAMLQGSKIHMVQYPSFTIYRTIEIPETHMGTPAITRDMKRLAIMHDEDPLMIWNLETTSVETVLPISSSVVLEWSTCGDLIAVNSISGAIQIWNVSSRQIVRTIEDVDFIFSAEWSCDDSVLMTISGFNNITLHSDHSSVALKGPFYTCSRAPRGPWFVGQTHHNRVGVFSMDAPTRCLKMLLGDQHMWSPDGRFIATTSSDGKLHIYGPYSKGSAARRDAAASALEAYLPAYMPDISALLSNHVEGWGTS